MGSRGGVDLMMMRSSTSAVGMLREDRACGKRGKGGRCDCGCDCVRWRELCG